MDSEPLSDPVDPEGFFSNSRSETATPDPAQVLTRSGFMLRLVKQGLRDLEIDATDLSTDPNALDRILLGFVAVVVFGRAVTNALQNLRSFDRQAFDAWYEPWRREMQNDALLRWFYVLRSEILKGIKPPIVIVVGASGQDAPARGTITVPDRPPPGVFRNQDIPDASVLGVCRLYVAYLEEMFNSFADVARSVHDRFIAEKQGSDLKRPVDNGEPTGE